MTSDTPPDEQRPARPGLYRVADTFENYWPTAANLGGGLGLAIGEMLNSTYANSAWPYVVFAAAAIAFCAGGIGSYRKAGLLTKERDRTVRLEGEVARLRGQLGLTNRTFTEHFEHELALLSDVLRFTPTERVSVYKHETDRQNGKVEEYFKLVSRYSPNPELRKRRRGVYPLDQGCIYEAWRKGESHEEKAPDPTRKLDAWVKRQVEKWKIPAETCKLFRMKCRSLSAFALRSPRTGEHSAVIVLESVRPNVFQQETLRELMQGSYGKRIAKFIDNVEDYLPKLELARREDL